MTSNQTAYANGQHRGVQPDRYIETGVKSDGSAAVVDPSDVALEVCLYCRRTIEKDCVISLSLTVSVFRRSSHKPGGDRSHDDHEDGDVDEDEEKKEK